jgi:hypothetical protein
MSELRAGLTAVYDRPSLPISYRVRLGRRFDPSPDVDAFVAELESHFHTELQRGPSCR